MRNVLIGISIMIVFGFVAASEASAQNLTPDGAARRFYELYLHSLNKNEQPLKKHRAELSKFVTRRLLDSYDRASRRDTGINVDFFIEAQDRDEAWENNISVSKAKIQGTRATVTVTLKGGKSMDNHKPWNNKLKVGLRKEAGAWKIDTVNNRTQVT